MSEVLLGRDREHETIGALLREATHAGAALVVEGEPGVGKSSLLESAAASARRLGFGVLRTTAAPSETRLPFAGLHGLLRPHIEAFGSLPAPQHKALAAAFGLQPGSTPDRFFIGLAVLTLLTELAADRPLLVLVDDAHLLDPASADVLAFVARRAGDEPIVTVFARRTDVPDPFSETEFTRLPLLPLSAAEATELVERQTPDLQPRLRRRVLDTARGNPLALEELARAAVDHGASIDPLAPLPVTDRLERSFAAQLAQLPERTRSALLVAALDHGLDIAATLRAATIVDPAAGSLEVFQPAEQAGLVTVYPNAVKFRHPVVRASVHSSATEAQRWTAHQALATVHASALEDSWDAGRRVWHLALSSVGHDDDLAAELERWASDALGRGAPVDAVAAMERAAELSSAPGTRGHLLLRAADIHRELGHGDSARDLLYTASELELTRADRLLLRSLLEATNDAIRSRSRDRDAATAIEAGLELVSLGEIDHAFSTFATLAERWWWTGTERRSRDLVVEAAMSIPVAQTDPRPLVVAALADPVERGAAVRSRLASFAADPDLDPLLARQVGTAAAAVWDLDVALPFISVAVGGLRRQGRLGLLASTLAIQAWTALTSGRPVLAEAAAEEAIRLSRETGQPSVAAAAELVRATTLGERGDLQSAAALASKAESSLLGLSAHPMLALVQVARGRLAVAHQRYAEGFEHLTRVIDPTDAVYNPNVATWAAVDYMEAAVHADRSDEAHRYLQELERMANATGAPFLAATVSYSRAIVASEGEAEARFRAALDGGIADWPVLHARLLLAYGGWLRRHRRLADSRAPLRAARDTFDALGLSAMAEATRRELRAAGEADRCHTVEAREQLTPQELQIASMAAAGLSNRDIGLQLHLSHRTVASHLYRIFPKLGVTSRTQLSHVLPKDPADDVFSQRDERRWIRSMAPAHG